MKKISVSIFILSVIGTLFAGSVTLRQYIAPATEPGIFSCVGFQIFGFSPCPYGLALFFILALLSGWHLRVFVTHLKLVWPLRFFGIVGVIFSGWVGWRELVAPALALGPTYWEIFSIARVPACVWGFFVFLAVTVLTWNLPSRRVI